MRSLTKQLVLALVIAAPAGAQTIAIVGGTVYPVSGPAISNGTVVIRDGRILAVGANVPVPADAQRIDAAGKIVTPGLVNAATQLTITEISAVNSTRNSSARGREGIAAAFTVWDGLNPLSVLVPPARAAGITTVVIEPRGGIIAGQAAVLHLVEGDAADIVMRAPAAMVGQIGAQQGGGGGGGQQALVQSRGELMMRLREVLDDARAYSRRKADYERAQTRQFAASRADLEALIPVLDGRVPLLLEADRSSDIESAIKLAQDYKLKLIIGGGSEAWMVAEKLAAAKVPVLTGAMNNIPRNFSTLGTRQENAGLLRRAGVTVALIGNAGGGDEDAFNVRNVRFEAGNAVAYGMSREDALRAITLTPAEIFGVADRVGSLQPGRDADVVVWSGDPFEFATQPEHVFIRGREVHDVTRQDMLEQRYRSLPPSYRRP
ncbi:MAG TPA: amidohydrolase family protein [Gemmatimonadaceae bacterium]|jgi:imidazolonepropionase-like amidohydrolase